MLSPELPEDEPDQSESAVENVSSSSAHDESNSQISRELSSSDELVPPRLYPRREDT